MFKISEILGQFRKAISKKSNVSNDTNQLKPDVTQFRNWYEEHYETVTIQRNLLFVLSIMLLFFSIAAVGAITFIVNAKKFDPFVIQIDDATGVATIVNPISTEVLGENEALAKYFIKKYVIARETYNFVDFDKEAKEVVRILSANNVYWSYRGYLRIDDNNPANKYGQKNTTYIKVKSWSKLSENKYILRFSINETTQNMLVYNKIAVIEFEYVPMELNETERDINPIGFQVTGYRVDDDNS